MSGRRANDPEGEDFSGQRNTLSKWLLGILTTITLAGGAGWMTYVQGQIGGLAAEQAKEKTEQGKRGSDLEVIREKVKRLEEDTREIKGDVKEQNRKLDELLRRTR